MSLIKIEAYEVKESKDGLKIPVVNGVHIHSQYNPRKEGEDLLKQHLHALEKKNNLLILGLGFGHHLFDIIKHLKSNNTSFNIAVIDPNRQVIDDCLKFYPELLKDITVYCDPLINKLFYSKELIDFLLEKPVIIPHAPSFNLYREYFTEYLTYKCSQRIRDVIDTLEYKEAKDYFKLCDPNLSIMNCFHHIESSRQFNESFEFILTSFGRLCGRAPNFNERES